MKLLLLFFSFYLSLMSLSARADEIWLGATTTLRDSGLLDEIIPPFEEETGHEVVVLVQPSGQLFQSAKDGVLDVLITHHPRLESLFLEEGYAIETIPILSSRFVLVGPKADPAGVKNMDIASAFAQIGKKKPIFVTRGDESGTSDRENAIWAEIEDVNLDFRIETGQGMGATLNIAQAMNAYVFSELATFASFENKGELVVLVDQPSVLENVYSISRLNPEKFKKHNLAAAETLIQYLTSEKVMVQVDNFTIMGEHVFVIAEN